MQNRTVKLVMSIVEYDNLNKYNMQYVPNETRIKTPIDDYTHDNRYPDYYHRNTPM